MQGCCVMSRPLAGSRFLATRRPPAADHHAWRFDAWTLRPADAILAGHPLLRGALERIKPLTDLNGLESDVLEQPQELCLRQSAADSTGPQVDVSPYGFRQLRRDRDVRIEEATTRA